MEVKQCIECNKLFRGYGVEKTCPECKRALEEQFREVKEYIRENKGVTVPEVSEHFGIEIKRVKEWLREDRIQLDETSGMSDLKCEKCGAVIFSGRLCRKCLLGEMADTIPKKYSVTVNSAKLKDKGKMRFFN